MTRLLIVEDNDDIAHGIREHLVRHGFDSRIVAYGDDVPPVLDDWRPDIIILDLMLPDTSGYDVLHFLRTHGHTQPVLILSAKNDEMAKVRGFRIGADDYVTKPFGLHELTERLLVLSRRSSAGDAADVPLHFGPVEIRPRARQALRDGVLVHLRPREFDLLIALVSRPGEVITRAHLLERAWAYEPGIESRTVDWHVAELRHKLGADDAHPLVETVRKVGYRWVEPRSHGIA